MKALITGSAGFVGMNLVPYMKERQWDVQTLDMQAQDEPGHLQYRLGSYQGLELDPEIEVIIHLASQSHVDRSISGPLAFIDDNVRGTLELFEAARKLPALKKILHFSTDEVGACLEKGSFYENFVFDCGSVYSASKGAQELLVQAYLKTYDLPIVITRCVNIFGSHQADEKLIPTICRKALASAPVPIYGSGMQQRQWVSVDHVCEYVTYVASAEFIPPKSVLHITGTKEVHNIMLAHAILAILQRPASLISHVPDRLGHDERYALGRSDRTDDFGCPTYNEKSFLADLKKTVEFYRQKFSEKSDAV